MNEFHNNVYENTWISKVKAKNDGMISIFWEENSKWNTKFYYLIQDQCFFEKSWSRWSRSFVVTHVFPYEAIEVYHKIKGTFKVNKKC
jgi:hypothetical protein